MRTLRHAGFRDLGLQPAGRRPRSEPRKLSSKSSPQRVSISSSPLAPAESVPCCVSRGQCLHLSELKLFYLGNIGSPTWRSLRSLPGVTSWGLGTLPGSSPDDLPLDEHLFSAPRPRSHTKALCRGPVWNGQGLGGWRGVGCELGKVGAGQACFSTDETKAGGNLVHKRSGFGLRRV